MRRHDDHLGFDPACAPCAVAETDRGCHALGHYRPTLAERAVARLRAIPAARRARRELSNLPPACPVCGYRWSDGRPCNGRKLCD